RREQLLRPPIAQVAESRDLAIHPDAAVEGDRHGDRVVVRRGVRADLLVLPDVVLLLHPACHERPERLDLLLPNIEEARADRRVTGAGGGARAGAAVGGARPETRAGACRGRGAGSPRRIRRRERASASALPDAARRAAGGWQAGWYGHGSSRSPARS